ncbi:MAG: hypothetical protein ACO1OF_16345 [Adhaeribacter sp.]
MKLKALLVIYYMLTLNNIPCYGQNGKPNDKGKDNKCPPGWEKHPEKHPACALLEPGTVLPVILKRFTAKTQGQTVFLTWEVTIVTDHRQYFLQYSSDAINFERSITTTQLNATDRPGPGTHYYRLGSEDVNGTRHYYNVIAVKLPPLENAVMYNLMGRPEPGADANDPRNWPPNKLLIIPAGRKVYRPN